MIQRRNEPNIEQSFGPRSEQDLDPIQQIQQSSKQRAEPHYSEQQRFEDWQPHLRQNRQSAMKRRTIYKAPSLDEQWEARSPTRRNLQIWFFILGFILPPGKIVETSTCEADHIAWIIASLLPLPSAPFDLEKSHDITLARYENALYWRKINRIMSLVGLGILVAIVSQSPLPSLG